MPDTYSYANANLSKDSREVPVWHVEWCFSAEGRWWPEVKAFFSEQAAAHFVSEARLYPRRYACLRIVQRKQEIVK